MNCEGPGSAGPLGLGAERGGEPRAHWRGRADGTRSPTRAPPPSWQGPCSATTDDPPGRGLGEGSKISSLISAKALSRRPRLAWPRKEVAKAAHWVCHKGNPTEVPRRRSGRFALERRPPPFGGRPSAKGVVMPPGGPLGPGILFGATDGRARLIEKARWHSPQNCSYFPRFCPQMVFRGSMHRAASNADPREGASP